MALPLRRWLCVPGPGGLRRHTGPTRALEALRHEHDGLGWTSEEVESYLRALDPDGQPTAYLFRCRVCGAHLAYSDFT
jgi:uncharacterized protein CbrC (UPF0167 family)